MPKFYGGMNAIVWISTSNLKKKNLFIKDHYPLLQDI